MSGNAIPLSFLMLRNDNQVLKHFLKNEKLSIGQQSGVPYMQYSTIKTKFNSLQFWGVDFYYGWHCSSSVVNPILFSEQELQTCIYSMYVISHPAGGCSQFSKFTYFKKWVIFDPGEISMQSKNLFHPKKLTRRLTSSLLNAL